MEINEEKINILQKAIETGEIIKIKYHGGSQPGSIREIAPNKFDGKMIYAFCYTSNATKSFSIDKIEIVSDIAIVSYDLDYMPPTLKEIYDKHKDEWEQLGWVVKTGEIYYVEELREVFDTTTLEHSEMLVPIPYTNQEKFGQGGMDIILLYRKYKNGKMLKHPTLSISYADEDLEQISYGSYKYKKHDKAIQKFLEDARNYFKIE